MIESLSISKPQVKSLFEGHCDLCGNKSAKIQKITNPSKVKSYKQRLGFEVTQICIACSLKVKESKKFENDFRIPRLRWDVKRAMDLGAFSEIEKLVERAAVIKRDLEKDTRAAIGHLEECTAKLNEVTISETTIRAAYSKLLWESYPERRLRADREISKFQLRIMIFGRDGNKCKRCGCRENLTIDHIIPVASGGDESTNNLQTLCKSCNSAKGSKTDFK